jgi:malate dehydrogenase (oxaloacetate-decarboxylating)(NADP+)
VHIDVGCNRKEYLADPRYMGLRQERDRSPAYGELIQEFFDACQDKYGRQVIIIMMLMMLYLSRLQTVCTLK